MENQHKQLNYDDFSDWIRALRYAVKKYTFLQEKIYFCKVKLFIGHGSSLDRPLQKAHTEHNPFLHWIEKKDSAQEELDEIEGLVNSYQEFLTLLTENECAVLVNLIYKKMSMIVLSSELQISRTTLYAIRNTLLTKWIPFYSKR